jgi:hypothetical protein
MLNDLEHLPSTYIVLYATSLYLSPEGLHTMKSIQPDFE